MANSGRCLCGAVRYTLTADPAFSAICHCRDCQRFTGSAFGAIVAVPKTAFERAADLIRDSAPSRTTATVV